MAVLSLIGATVFAPVQNAPVAPSYDVVGNVFSSDQRKMIGRDSQCKDARSAADQFAETKGRDVQVAVAALKAIEHCASLSRIGDWKDYNDYLWTAAAGVAYDIGILAAEPKGLQHAIAAAKNVSGFQAPASLTSQVTTRSGDSPASTETSVKNQAVNAATDAGAPVSNNSHYQTQSVHTTGYSGSFGALATQIAAAAQSALDISKGAGR